VRWSQLGWVPLDQLPSGASHPLELDLGVFGLLYQNYSGWNGSLDGMVLHEMIQGVFGKLYGHVV
jgi:hypothetical protein